MSPQVLRRADPRDPLVCVRSRFWNYNAVGLADPEAACVIDPGIDPDEISTLATEVGGPVTRVVLTHSHHDHIRGWQRFPGARVIAPRTVAEKDAGARERILASKRWLDERLDVHDPEFGYPEVDETFGEEARFQVGNHEVILQFLPGHSNCTSVVWIPSLSTLLTADYLVEPGLPYCRWQARDFEKAMATMEAFCEAHRVRRVIPSHNDWVEGEETILAAIRRERRYFEVLRHEVQAAKARGEERVSAERSGAQAVRRWREQDVGKRERQDLDNARRVADEVYAALSSM